MPIRTWTNKCLYYTYWNADSHIYCISIKHNENKESKFTTVITSGKAVLKIRNGEGYTGTTIEFIMFYIFLKGENIRIWVVLRVLSNGYVDMHLLYYW